jgi:hypothetical protein
MKRATSRGSCDEPHPPSRQTIARAAGVDRQRTSSRSWALSSKEADECGFWLVFLVRIDVVQPPRAASLSKEANELVAIFVAARKTAMAKRK